MRTKAERFNLNMIWKIRVDFLLDQATRAEVRRSGLDPDRGLSYYVRGAVREANVRRSRARRRRGGEAPRAASSRLYGS